jgi:hypothetical protein
MRAPRLILGANQQVNVMCVSQNVSTQVAFQLKTDRNPTVPTNQLASLRQQFRPEIPQSQGDDIDLT